MLTKKMLSYASCEVEAFLPTGPFDQYRKTIKHLLNISTEKASRGTQDYYRVGQYYVLPSLNLSDRSKAI